MNLKNKIRLDFSFMSEVKVQTEPVDDIPLLVRQQQEMGIAEVIDDMVKRHGNRIGLSLGQMISGWLTYIVSESDHRLSYVEDWAASRLATLTKVMGTAVMASDFSDDRLGDGLRILSLDAVWEAIESQLNHRLLRVYDLEATTVRIDTTTLSLYHDSEESVLIAYGLSKDHRPDLAQIKVLLLTLDPLALPAVTMVLPGNRADDGLYVPAIQTAQASLGNKPLLYVGDSKMEALATRAHIVQSGAYYLVPLSHKGCQGQLLAETVQRVWQENMQLEDIYALPQADEDTARLLAQGWETTRGQTLVTAEAAVQWTERLLLVYSPTLAQSGYRGLEKRLQTAMNKVARLTPAPGRGQRQFRELPPLQAEVEKVLKEHQVAEFLQVHYHQQVEERYRRGYKGRPAQTERIVRYQLTVSKDEPAIQTAYQAMGWRLFVTNAPPTRLSLAEAVRTYRGGVPTIERLLSRLKGRPLGLRPVFVHRDDHLAGLVRLLSLALRILTLTEFVVERSLQTEGDALAGLYPGNPTRTTNHPTAERLLRAFKGVTLSLIELPGQAIQHVSPLSPLQNRILQLLKFSDSIYTDLALPLPNPP
jgi:transposase